VSKVLLVDDEAAMRFALSEVLDGFGVEVLTAGSTEEALPLIEGVDVVVTDYAMPGKTGLDLLDAVRAHDPTVPVIVITAQLQQVFKGGVWPSRLLPFMANIAIDFCPDIADQVRLVAREAIPQPVLKIAQQMLVPTGLELRGPLGVSVSIVANIDAGGCPLDDVQVFRVAPEIGNDLYR